MANLLAFVQHFADWAASHRGFMLRGLLLVAVWGLALFGYASLGEQALNQRIPPFQQAAEAYALQVGDVLANRRDLLTPLASDPRISEALAKEDGVNGLDIRRALYEFGYLNRVTNLYVWDSSSGNVAQLASSTPLDSAVTAWLNQLDEDAAFGIFNREGTPFLMSAMRVARAANATYVLQPLSLSNLQSDLPPAPKVGDSSLVVRLLAASDDSVWDISPNIRSKPITVAWASASRLHAPDHFTNPDGLLVTAPIPLFPQWAVGVSMPSGVMLGTSALAQYALLGFAALATLVILWKPTRPMRRKMTDKLAPVMRIVGPLAAPILSSVAAVVRGTSQRAEPIRVDLSEPPKPTPHDNTPARRGKLMNLGSSSTSKGPRPVTPTYVPALKGSLPPALAEEAEPELNPLAEMVDACFTHDRTQLLYQPIYNARNGMPVMHEVLLRLIDTDGQPMTPSVFIPVCQKHGWMERLDAHVAEKVLRLNFAGGLFPRTPLALNISGDTMESIAYLDSLLKDAETEILKHLVFEMRSQELIQDPSALDFLKHCKELGVKISVDYFGGGTAMVESTKKLGFDYVKMDCLRFGGDVIAKKELINLCRTAMRVELPIVLEKMETVEMEVYARRIGVHYLQGYLLGKPKADLVTGPLPGWRDMAKEEVIPLPDIMPPKDVPEASDPASDDAPPASPGSSST